MNSYAISVMDIAGSDFDDPMLPIVTRRFIRGIIRSGRLTEARLRHEAGTARPGDRMLDSRSCWSLVCEEVLDTDHEPEDYDAIYAELLRRGFRVDEIDEMRRLAWRTAGWLNYDLMLWEWCHLDEGDMRSAVELKRKGWWPRKGQLDRDLAAIERCLERDPPSAGKGT